MQTFEVADLARRHLDLIKNNYRLFVSLFAVEFFPGTNGRGRFGYDDPYLLEIITATYKVFTDNQAMIKRMLAMDGFGIPNTILEAIAVGLPVMASDDGGVNEVIRDGETGILIEDMYNPDAYAERIKQISDITELDNYVKNAQELIKERHSWSTFTKNVKKDIVTINLD